MLPTRLDDDDRPIGRLLNRREVLALLGVGAGGAIIVACAPSALSTLSPSLATTTASPLASGLSTVPSCMVRPEQTEGPYFVDEKLNRSDIRADTNSGSLKEGVALGLALAVARIEGSTCVAFDGALVDVWHCDALGVYSDVNDPSGSTVGQNFLRGYQVTDTTGAAAFTTIYPGWYSGRAVHIHFKIRTDPDASAGLEFTSQLFFTESVTAEVYSQAPYAAKGTLDTPNSTDGIYRNGGDQLLLTPTRSRDGYAATFDIGVVV